MAIGKINYPVAEINDLLGAIKAAPNIYATQDSVTQQITEATEGLFMQAPRVEIIRTKPLMALGDTSIEDYKRMVWEGRVKISHPYKDAHPDEDCFFAVMRYGKIKRAFYNGANTEKTSQSRKKWNFYKGPVGLSDENDIIRMGDDVSYVSFVSTLACSGAWKLKNENGQRYVVNDMDISHTREDESSPHMIYMREYDERGRINPQTLTQTIPTDFPLATNKSSYHKFGIALVKRNTKFVEKQNAKDNNYYWNAATGEYKWIISEVFPVQLYFINDLQTLEGVIPCGVRLG